MKRIWLCHSGDAAIEVSKWHWETTWWRQPAKPKIASRAIIVAGLRNEFQNQIEEYSTPRSRLDRLPAQIQNDGRSETTIYVPRHLDSVFTISPTASAGQNPVAGICIHSSQILDEHQSRICAKKKKIGRGPRVCSVVALLIGWLRDRFCASNSQILDISAWRAAALPRCLIHNQALCPEHHKADHFSSFGCLPCLCTKGEIWLLD